MFKKMFKRNSTKAWKPATTVKTGVMSVILAVTMILCLTSCSSVEGDAKKLAKLQYKVYELKERQSKILSNAVGDVLSVLSGSKSASETETAKLVKEVTKLTEDLDKLKSKLEAKYSGEELKQLYKLTEAEFAKLKK
jgi:ubiquinone biosynthesis protein UbiJ